jgi:polyisoprenoid-binding protein YceI
MGSCPPNYLNIMQARTTFSLLIVTVLMGWGLVIPATAQTYTVTDASTMTIYGSANVTDWEAKVNTIRGEISIRNGDQTDFTDADPSWLKSVRISMPVEDIDSDSRRMNNNMHGYLKKDQHPAITYRLVEVQELALAGNPGIVLTVRGIVTAAGVEKEIVHDVEIVRNESGGLVVSGSQDLLMTDFGIDPPTAMLGSIRSRDEMTITFELHLDQK